MPAIINLGGISQTQSKTVTAGTSNKTVTPDQGFLLDSVIVQPTPSQSKNATPSTSSQTITPDSGKLLSSVIIAAQTPVVEHLHISSGRSRSQSYTFTKAYKTVILTSGGYGACSVSSGSGWTQVAFNSDSGTKTDADVAYCWRKNNVAANESVTMSLGDRNGFNIIGIN